MDFSLISLPLFSLHQSVLFFILIAFIIFLHVMPVNQLTVVNLHLRPWQLGKENLNSLFFLKQYI